MIKLEPKRSHTSLASIFNKHLENALKFQDDSTKLQLIATDLFNSFEILICLYAEKSKWTEIFDLVDKIESFFKLVHADKSRLLKQDEYYRLIGDLFYKIDKEMYALDFYGRSLKLSHGSNLLSMESYENLLNSLVERWHYRMLNDNVRNEAYRKAIQNKVTTLNRTSTERINILDIGTGTGLLSAICLAEAFKVCSESDRLRVFSCEMNSFFYSISSQFLGSLNLGDSSMVLNKHSNDLSRKDDFANKSIQLIITEIFDDGLLGEGCLDTFYNALVENDLMANRPIQVIPRAAKIYLCAIECDHLRESNRYIGVFKETSEFNTIKATCLDNAFKFSNDSSSEFNYEPYTTESMQNIPFKQMVNIVELDEFNINFDDKSFLEKYCKQNEITTIQKQIKAIQNGRIDAYVIWFDLELDKDTILTNSPFLPADESKFVSKCWHQALYSVCDERLVNIGQELDVDVVFSKDCILVNHIIADEEVAMDAQKPSEINLTLHRYEIQLLNNIEYQEFYCDWFEKVYAKWPANQTDSNTSVCIGFLSSTFSRLFFKMILEYHSRFKAEKNVDLIVEIYLSDRSIDQVDEGFELNLHESFAGFSFLQVNSLNDLLVGKCTSEKKTNLFNLNYLICEPVDFKYGILRKNILADLSFIKDFNSNKGIKKKQLLGDTKN